jgi:DNA invertase Pin-like site-specific DNA recombinase
MPDKLPAVSDKTPEPPIPAVLYAAKSTEDKRGSIKTQLEDCRTLAKREGWEIIGEFSDEAFSAFSGNRGPAFQDAKALAANRGGCVLVAQDADRFARGAGDAPGAADHLGEVYFAMNRQGVELWTVRSGKLDLVRAVIEGERSHDESARKTQAVKAGKRRAVERGEWVGGILADGYRVIRGHDGARATRRVERDPDRKEIYDLIWDCARAGFSSGAIVVELDRNGYRTNPRKRGHKSRPFDANRIRQTLDNPFYAGLAVAGGEVVGEGNWPRYVEPEDFYRLKRERHVRAHVEHRSPGRPPEGYLLARLAVCECGSPMDTITGHHIRKDGTYPRRYVCRKHRERPQDCAARPFDAAAIDAALIPNLAAVVGDVDLIREGAKHGREALRARLEGEVTSAQEEAASQQRGLERMQRRIAALYADGEDAKAAALEEALVAGRAQIAEAEIRRDAALDALQAADEDGTREIEDAAFWSRLQADLTDASDDIKRLNLTLADYLDQVVLLRLADGRVRLIPRLSGEAAARAINAERSGIHIGGERRPGDGPFREGPVIAVGENPRSPW